METRWNKKPKFHYPIGKSNTLRGANLSVQELLKSTSLEHKRGVIESFLVEKDPADIEDEKLLRMVDLSQSPLDLTDAEDLVHVAQKQIRDAYEAHLARQKAIKKAEMSRNSASGNAKTSQTPQTQANVNVQ